MATKATTRKASKKSGSRRSSVATESKPRVKSLAQDKPTEKTEEEETSEKAAAVEEAAVAESKAPESEAYWVELIEGATYGDFIRNRPVVITNVAILKAVLRNGRFKCRPAGGGE